MPRRRRRQASPGGALAIVRQARNAAKKALDSLREEIKLTSVRLQKLVSEERSFKDELFGAVQRRFGRAGGQPRRAAKTGLPVRTGRVTRRKGPPKAERYFNRLSKSFTLEDVRKVAGRAAGISLAQWSRAKRIRKAGKGYEKIG